MQRLRPKLYEALENNYADQRIHAIMSSAPKYCCGGTLININILDGEKLMEAHKDPTLHPDLVVRVSRFTAYFASLSPDFRELVVKRFLEGM